MVETMFETSSSQFGDLSTWILSHSMIDTMMNILVSYLFQNNKIKMLIN